VIYAGNYFVAKGLMPAMIGPSGFIALRVVVAGLMFHILASFLGRQKIDRADYARLALCGLTGVAINQLCFFNGLALTSAVHASLIMTINPICVLIASALLLGSSITGRKITGIALGGLGAAALLWLSGGGDAGLSDSSIKGDLLVLTNALAYGVYLVIVKPLMKKYKPITVISWVFLFGALFALPFGVGEVLEIQWQDFEAVHVQGVVYVIVGTTFMAYLLNIYALGIVEPTVVSIYIYLQPIIVTVVAGGLAYIGYSNYSGDFTLKTALSGIAIFTGVWLVSVPKGWLRNEIKV
jgi:drug/metabolite transporter (DMT)-like permease